MLLPCKEAEGTLALYHFPIGRARHNVPSMVIDKLPLNLGFKGISDQWPASQYANSLASLIALVNL